MAQRLKAMCLMAALSVPALSGPSNDFLHYKKSMMNLLMDYLPLLLALLAVGIAVASLIGYLGRFWWGFELFTHFRLQYAGLAAICALGFLLLGELAGFFISTGIALFNLAFIYPLYRRESNPASPERTYRILTANILGKNGQHQKIVQMVKDANPDFVLLLEYDHRHHESMSHDQLDYPHKQFLPQDDNYGLAFFSRLPVSSEIVYLNQDIVPALVARLELDGQLLTIIGTHPPPPRGQKKTALRDHQMAALARFASQQNGEIILLGDLNTTSWSYVFQDLLRDSKLLDSREGFGLQPTWPSNLPLMRIPIDHVLHSQGIQISNRSTGPFSGSDHRPVIVDFYMKDQQTS
jgi:endonuclease/exonuclease/phosphatase (EEP) superfamily protein YafD